MLSEVQYFLSKTNIKPNIRIHIDESNFNNLTEMKNQKIIVDEFLFENSFKHNRINLKIRHIDEESKISTFYNKILTKIFLNKEIFIDSFILALNKSYNNNINTNSEFRSKDKFDYNANKIRISKFSNLILKRKLINNKKFNCLNKSSNNSIKLEFEDREIEQLKIIKNESKKTKIKSSSTKSKNKFSQLINKYSYNNTSLNKENVSSKKLACYTMLSNIAFKLPKS